MKRFLAIAISLVLLLGCAPAGTAEAGSPFVMKTFPVYFGTADQIWREDFPLYFREGAEDLPFAELNDWVALMLRYKEKEQGYQLTFEEKDGNKVRLTRENKFFMEIDFAEGKIGFPDYLGFIQKADGDYMSLNEVPEKDKDGQPFLLLRTRNVSLYGDYTVLDLKKYDIPMAVEDGKYLLPLQTLSGLILSPQHDAVYFNGEGVFVSEIGEMTDPKALFEQKLNLYGILTPEVTKKISEIKGTREEIREQSLEIIRNVSPQGKQLVEEYEKAEKTSLYVKYAAAPKAPRSQALIDFGYNELCFELDCFYGQKATHNITDFNTYFMQNGLIIGLKDPDAAVADKAMADLVSLWMDDGHSSYVSSSYLSSTDPERTRGISVERLVTAVTDLATARKDYPEAQLPYYESGDTAYVTFDSFAGTHTDDVNGFADYYKLSEEDKLPDDTIGIIIKAHRQITRENSPIKNVVLDLSNNGGGEVSTALFTLGWMMGEGNISVRNTLTGSEGTSFIKADVNLDHQFDEQDTLMGRGLHVYCLTSPYSFSCGNLVPWALKADGRVILLGRTTGGGSCIVGSMTTAWGTSINMSSFYRLSFVKNGAYYDVDQGVVPDHVIDSYEHYFDRETLTAYIDGLY